MPLSLPLPSADFAIGPVPHYRFAAGQQTPAPGVLRHTSFEKASLAAALNPFVALLLETASADWQAEPETLAARPTTLGAAGALAADVLRLMAGESCAVRAEGFSALSTPEAGRFAVLLVAYRLRDALRAFEKTYFGFNPLLGAEGWAVTGTASIEQSRWLAPRPDAKPFFRAAEDSPSEVFAKLLRRERAAIARASGLAPRLQKSPAPAVALAFAA